MKKKPFIITIDTEGDNIWEHHLGGSINVKNSLFLQRFQNLCDKYGFKPVYLVNYEMANCDSFIEFAKKVLKYGGCEIGMHLHAWNTPPIVELKQRDDGFDAGLPYITEYDNDTIREKVNHLTKLIEKRFGVKPVSHRSGRWSMNQEYAKILESNGYKYDCTFTPLHSWADCPGFTNSSFGNDYSLSKKSLSSLFNTLIKEIPFQYYANHRIRKEKISGFKSFLKNVFYAIKRKEKISLRPNGHNLSDLLYIVKKNHRSSQKYLMFMLHSSELMPGGSPTFDSDDKIETLYADLEILFKSISTKYYGVTLKQFGDLYNR